MGAKAMYEATQDVFYLNFLKEHVDKYILEDGTILGYNMDSYNLDNINAGKVLFYLYENTKEEKYKIAIDTLMDQLKDYMKITLTNLSCQISQLRVKTEKHL